MASQALRVVFDTNIFISAFAFPGSKAELAYFQAQSGVFELYTSLFILSETAEVLEEKFKWSKAQATSALLHIANTAHVRRTQPTLHILSDEPDNRILECAELVKANLIVTGDKKLLTLGRHKGARVISLSDFLTILFQA